MPDLSFWEVNDKLCYWVLIPALLFHFISQVSLSSEMLYIYAVIVFAGFVVTFSSSIFLGKILGYAPEVWTSILQGSMRQNAFIALAIAGSFYGSEGLKIASLFMFIYVPSINIIIITTMVMSLNKSNQKDSKKAISNIFIEISKNPFILAMIAGLLVSLFPLERMSVLIGTTELLGSAALPIMLLTIGAKIKVRDLTLKITPIIISNSLKLIILPVIVYFVASYFNLSQIEIVVAVIFASVPTAAMSYSLAQQFGADHQLMRAILTTQVALSFITIPLLLAFIA
ncbi:MAG: AEC family transporter [Candidatus Pseudothioglobus sp.]